MEMAYSEVNFGLMLISKGKSSFDVTSISVESTYRLYFATDIVGNKFTYVLRQELKHPAVS